MPRGVSEAKGGEEAMEVLIPARPEEDVLKAVQDDATAEEIYQAIVERSENCVDPRCGCKTCS